MPIFAAGQLVAAPLRFAISRTANALGNISSEYDGTVCWQRQGVFGTLGEGIAVGDFLGTTIVGRLAGSAILLGLRQNIVGQFPEAPRGANGYPISLSGVDSYYLWETKKYFQKRNTPLYDPPRVCLVSANQYQLPVLNDSFN